MLAPWVLDEMKTADLKDKRLDNRLNEILSALAQLPTASIPAACGGNAEMTAAYRFFDNPKATFESVLAPHIDSTRERIAKQAVVLFVQDTTELDVTRPEQQVVGVGPLDGSSRCGLFLHEMHVFTPDGTPLGTIAASIFAREEDDGSKTAEEKRKERRAAPIEDKESYRWLEGLRQARAEAEQLPGVQCICISDSEADIYELFAEPLGQAPSLDWIVRACQDRALMGTAESAKLNEEVLKQPVLFTHTITVRGRDVKVSCEERTRRQARETRATVVETRAARVTLRPPARPNEELPEVTVNAVLVREVNPPAGEPRVEWLLLTTLPIDGVEQVRQVIQYYCTRWMIEVFFRTLKSGCRIEERRFEHVDRLKPAVAIYLIAAWRTLYVCRLGRSCPDISCEAVFEPSEWKSVYVVVTKKPVPQTPPTLAIMIRLIAQLGGYVNRPREDPPGAETVWKGMQRMFDLAVGWDTFGPGARETLMFV